MTTNPGRSRLGVPRPYDSHEPSEGRPGCSDPVWMKVMAGSWLMASVWTERTTVMSSAIFLCQGSSSLIHVPSCPHCSKS